MKQSVASLNVFPEGGTFLESLSLEDKGLIEKAEDIFVHFIADLIPSFQEDMPVLAETVYDLLSPKKKTLDEIKIIVSGLVLTTQRMNLIMTLLEPFLEGDKRASDFYREAAIAVGMLQCLTLAVSKEPPELSLFLVKKIVQDWDRNSDTHVVVTNMVAHIFTALAMLADLTDNMEGMNMN